MPAARALSSPSGEAAEDNVVEGENSQQHAVFWAGGITLRYVPLRSVTLRSVWTDRRGI